jgi:hypothetical protein
MRYAWAYHMTGGKLLSISCWRRTLVNQRSTNSALCIYEADYYLLLSIQWQNLTHLPEDNQLLNEGQYGAQSECDAHTSVFIEEMQYEICRASRKPLVKFDNDATSCYDRILPNMTAIACRKFGLHKNMAFVWAKTLEEAKYKLRTMLGVSEETYSHCIAFLIYGTGRGSGNSPVVWCFLTSILFDCHASKAHGAVFESPDKKSSIQLFMIGGYVDDSNDQVNIFTADHPPTPETLITMMQHDAQLWSDLL